jgi:hypothetical protein
VKARLGVFMRPRSAMPTNIATEVGTPEMARAPEACSCT